MSNPLTLFTKPWPTLSLVQLTSMVRDFGFDGIELPVRPGYQITPENAARELARALNVLNGEGIQVPSLAADPTPELIRTVGETSQTPIIRVMLRVADGASYLTEEARFIREIESLVPHLESSGVRLGLQNHDGAFVANACGLRRILDHFDPRHVTAVWDPGHCALAGEIPQHALDILDSHLSITNFKNPVRVIVSKPKADEVVWSRRWVSAREGLAHWSTIARLLQDAHFTGPICFHPEYSDEESLERLLLEDVAFARTLFSRSSS